MSPLYPLPAEAAMLLHKSRTDKPLKGHSTCFVLFLFFSQVAASRRKQWRKDKVNVGWCWLLLNTRKEAWMLFKAKGWSKIWLVKLGQTKTENKDKHWCGFSQMEIADEGQVFSEWPQSFVLDRWLGLNNVKISLHDTMHVPIQYLYSNSLASQNFSSNDSCFYCENKSQYRLH